MLICTFEQKCWFRGMPEAAPAAYLVKIFAMLEALLVSCSILLSVSFLHFVGSTSVAHRVACTLLFGGPFLSLQWPTPQQPSQPTCVKRQLRPENTVMITVRVQSLLLHCTLIPLDEPSRQERKSAVNTSVYRY